MWVGLLGLLCAAVFPCRAAALPLVGHHGRWLTDPQGRVVVLHGLQVDKLQLTAPVQDVDLSRQNVRFIAGEGFNVARVSMSYSGVEPTLGQFDDHYVHRYRALDAELARAGVYDLIDMMQGVYSAPLGGWGFPDWMTLTDGALNNREPFPRGYLDNPAEQRAWDNLWANARASDGVGLQDHYAAGLRRLGSELAASPGLLGFELINEPWPGSGWITCASPLGCLPGGFDQTSLTRFYRHVIPVLRGGDPRHLIFYEPNLLFDFGAATNIGAVGDPSVVFAFHDYCLGAAPGFPALPDLLGLCGIDERLVLDNAEALATRLGAGLLMDEWGNTTDLALIARMAREADQHMVGWTEWAYEDCCNSPAAIVRNGSRPPTGENLNLPVLRALVRPYPQAVAGTPTAWSYDPTSHRFHLSYATRPVGGGARIAVPTRLEVPPLQYPTGYDAAVTGGRIASAPDADPLLVTADATARDVEVTVTPAQHHPPSGAVPGRCGETDRWMRLPTGGRARVVAATLYVDGLPVTRARGARLHRIRVPGGLANGSELRTAAKTAGGATLTMLGSIRDCQITVRQG